jgi:protein TonB
LAVLRQRNSLSDFVTARRAFLSAREALSDRLAGMALTAVLFLALAVPLTWTVVSHVEAPPPPIMVQVVETKQGPRPKMTFTKRFLRIPVPQVIAPNVVISNAPLGTSAAPSTTTDTAYMGRVAAYVRGFPVGTPRGTGEVDVNVIIDRTGSVLYTTVAQGSGTPALDQAALDQVNKANPLPAVPDSVHGDMLYMLIPFCFKGGAPTTSHC